jgi:hypothetical protein
MAQQVLYDTASAQVLQWQDTDKLNYAPPLTGMNTLAVTSAEWANQDGTWYVVNGSLTQTNPNAPTAAQLLAQAQTAQITSLKSSYQSAIASIPIVINGTDYQLDNSPASQTTNLNLAMSMQVIMSSAQPWAASTAVSLGSYCTVSGAYLFCSQAGTTGSSAPTPPTAFGTSVSDGTAAWELLGRNVDMSDGTFVLMTPQEILSGSQQAEMYLHTQKSKLVALIAQVQAATTVASVQDIVW